MTSPSPTWAEQGQGKCEAQRSGVGAVEGPEEMAVAHLFVDSLRAIALAAVDGQLRLLWGEEDGDGVSAPTKGADGAGGARRDLPFS